MTEKCTICNIVSKDLKSYIIYEDDFFIAFLDSRPLFLGHALLAPKMHFQTIYDLPLNKGNNLLSVTQKVGNAVMAGLNAEGTFIAINNNVSQSIHHLHIHIVPRNKGDGLKGFFWPRTKYKDEEEIKHIQQLIKNSFH